MKQGYNSRMDESLGARNGKKKQSLKSRRDESKVMNKLNKGKAFASVGTMDKPKKKVVKKMVTKPKPTAKARAVRKVIKKTVRKVRKSLRKK